MRKFIHKSIMLLMFFVLTNCKTKKEVLVPTNEAADVVDEKPKRPQQIIARIGKFPDSPNPTSAPITIDSAFISGNTLHLKTTYFGGCKYHRFEFVGNPAIMKSNPPKRTAMLIHYDDEDICGEKINEEIEIDIRALSITETRGSEIILLIEGYSTPISYIYP